MKIFEVVTGRDGYTVRAPGVSETEVIREKLLFAANSIEEVWDYIKWIRDDPEQELLAIAEAAEAVTIIGKR